MLSRETREHHRVVKERAFTNVRCEAVQINKPIGRQPAKTLKGESNDHPPSGLHNVWVVGLASCFAHVLLGSLLDFGQLPHHFSNLFCLLSLRVRVCDQVCVCVRN